MKHALRVGIMVAVMSLPGFAVQGDSATVRFAVPVRVGSTDLRAGIYKVTWTEAGVEAQVSFAQGKKVIATAAAKFAQADNEATTSGTANRVAAVTAQEGNTTVLLELKLPHSNLSFESNARATQ